MVMPKKGTRRMVINNQTYTYKVRYSESCPWCRHGDKTISIQNSNTRKLVTIRFSSEDKEVRANFAITPKYVKNLILENNL